MCSPSGVALDASDNLYTGDFLLQRVMRFQPAKSGTPPPSLTATATLGQASLTIFNNGGPARPFSITVPTIAIDKSVTPNRLYATDGQNNRVLAWNDITSATNGQPADLVLGQPDFELNGCNDGTASGDVNGVGPDSLCFPVGLGVDANGNVYVADTLNNRVLEYTTPFAGCASLPCVGPAASFVIGQSSASDFVGIKCAQPPTLTAKGLCLPDAVAFDAAANLYVADSSNCRVLEYSNPMASPSPNVTADTVFGQGTTGSGSEFTTNVCGDGVHGNPDPTANTLSLPAGVTFDQTGNMYVADSGACRALEYNTPLANPAAPNVTANTVWGQAGKFTTAVCSDGVGNDPPPSATGLGQTVGVALDVLSNLYIADLGNNRVLEFDSPLANPSSPNVTANAVYGQGASGTDFTANSPAVGQTGMDEPASVGFDSENRVVVADSFNYRVLIFPQTTPPAPTVNVGRVVVPIPKNKGVLADKNVEAGAFKYTNLTDATQQITSVTVTVTKPQALSSLSVSAGNSSGSISPVFPTTTIPLAQPVSVTKNETVKFELRAVTAAPSTAAIANRVGYASIIATDHSPIGPVGWGLMLMGLTLMPLGIRQRRRTLLLICLAIGLMAAGAGCNGGTATFPPTTATRSVKSDGTTSNPAKLSIITVFSGQTTTQTTQSLTSVTFGG